MTYISTNQNALNFKISRENVRFQAIFFPFKEQSCYTALLKTEVFRAECCKHRWGKYVVKEECKSDSQFNEIDDEQLVNMCEKAEKGAGKKV